MPSCAIKWCGKCTTTSSYTKDGITFHRFPNDDIETKDIWIKATHRDNFFPSKFSVVCSRHFMPDCFESLKNNRRRLHRSSVPTLYLPVLNPPSGPIPIESSDTTATLDLAVITKTEPKPESGESEEENDDDDKAFVMSSSPEPEVTYTSQIHTNKEYSTQNDPDSEKKKLQNTILLQNKKIKNQGKLINKLKRQNYRDKLKITQLKEVIKGLEEQMATTTSENIFVNIYE